MVIRKIATFLAVAGASMLLAAACGNADTTATAPVTTAGPTPTIEFFAEPTTPATVEFPVETPTPPIVETAVKTPTPPVVESPGFDLEMCATTRAAQLPIEFEFAGTVPTGFDGINQANCTFTKAVETVTVTLTGPAKHTEIFTMAEPTPQVAFPLPDGTLSISTLEIVAPGEYQREISVTSVDGETLVISNQPGVLTTVMVLEPGN